MSKRGLEYIGGVSTSILSLDGLSASAKLVLIAYASHRGRKETAWPSVRCLAAELHLSTSTVRQAQATLESMELLIEVKRGQGGADGSNEYIPNVATVATATDKQDVAIPDGSCSDSHSHNNEDSKKSASEDSERICMQEPHTLSHEECSTVPPMGAKQSTTLPLSEIVLGIQRRLEASSAKPGTPNANGCDKSRRRQPDAAFLSEFSELETQIAGEAFVQVSGVLPKSIGVRHRPVFEWARELVRFWGGIHPPDFYLERIRKAAKYHHYTAPERLLEGTVKEWNLPR